MKFRRNIKEENLFHKVALFSLIAEIVLLTIYFITICTQNRRCILSRIVGTGVLDCPQQKNFGRDIVFSADLCYNGITS